MRRWWISLGPLAFACRLLTTATPTAPPPTPIPEASPQPTPTAVLLPTAEPTPAEAPSPPATSFPDPAAYRWEPVAAGFSRPLDLQHAGDGRLFVVEQEGRILIVSEGQTLDPPFLDIRDRVGATALERGLLGLAFHPRFTENGAFYVNYTDRNGDTVVARFLVSSQPNVADPASEVILLRIDQPFANHNGGVLAFGPDGYLYIGTGDGGSGGDPQGNGQRLDTLLGKILRIDVDGGSTYAIPPDNPFAAGGGLPEIWAYGLRNPWRMAFDTATGDLYIADVGQNQWEEVNFQPAGAPGGVNYGWNLREGRHRFAGDRTEGLIDPVAEYATRLNGCSITGGVVVRNPGLREWNGIYLYGDWCSGRVWGLLRDASGEWQTQQLFNTSYNISSFGVDHAGEVYLVDHGGAVYRLGPTE